MDTPSPPPAAPTVLQGRLYIVLASVLWSLSGAFTKLLTQDTWLGLNEPELSGLDIAFYRVFFAGLAFVPTLRPRDVSFRPLLLVMVLTFALMNALFVSAMRYGSAANAILLQYTAPIWMYLASVWLLGEAADRRSSVSLVLGLAGIAVIVYGEWSAEAPMPVVAMGLGSGVTYAVIVICLRVLRDAPPNWLTLCNHLGGGLLLLPFLLYFSSVTPTWRQLAFLFFFGTVQLSLPYWFMARGLRAISPQEAGAITLLEPLLNPVWAYLVSPETETPKLATCVGGTCILGALAWRYLPWSEQTAQS